MANKFVIDSVTYTANDNGTYVFRNEKTIGYCFINTGNCAISLNNYKLQPNSSFKTFERGMIDATNWQMLFATFNSCSTSYSELTCLIYSLA